MEHSKVKFTMENGGEFIVELYPEYAPATVENFLSLVNDGFYDGLTFHRVVEGFMAQGGDPTGTGSGGSKKKIKGEFAANGVDNPIKHTRGVISMARAMDPHRTTRRQASFSSATATAAPLLTEAMRHSERLSRAWTLSIHSARLKWSITQWVKRLRPLNLSASKPPSP